MDIKTAFAESLYGYIGVGFWKTAAGRALWWFGGGILAGVIVAAVLWLLWRERDARLTAYDRVRCELNDLSGRRSGDKPAFRRWYFELVRVVKRYLKDRCGLVVADKTDVEVVRMVAGLFAGDEIKAGVESLLAATLGIRFADEAALQEQAGRDVALAVHVVERCEAEMRRKEAAEMARRKSRHVTRKN